MSRFIHICQPSFLSWSPNSQEMWLKQVAARALPRPPEPALSPPGRRRGRAGCPARWRSQGPAQPPGLAGAQGPLELDSQRWTGDARGKELQWIWVNRRRLGCVRSEAAASSSPAGACGGHTWWQGPLGKTHCPLIGGGFVRELYQILIFSMQRISNGAEKLGDILTLY